MRRAIIFLPIAIVSCGQFGTFEIKNDNPPILKKNDGWREVSLPGVDPVYFYNPKYCQIKNGYTYIWIASVSRFVSDQYMELHVYKNNYKEFGIRIMYHYVSKNSYITPINTTDEGLRWKSTEQTDAVTAELASVLRSSLKQ